MLKAGQIALLLALVCLCACQPDTSCRQDLDVTAGVTLKGTTIDSLGVGIEFTSWDSITVQGAGNDSLLYDNSKSINRLSLPLRGDTTYTVYRLNWHGQDAVITVKHDNTQRFISMACGCVVYHTIEAVSFTGSWIDSVKIINSAVEPAEQENVTVYLTVRD